MAPVALNDKRFQAHMPQANKFTVKIMAAVAEQEAEAFSKRTRAALQAAKERGTKLGGRRVSAERFVEIQAQARQAHSAEAARGAAKVLPVIAEIQGRGARTLRAIAAELNSREIDAPWGGGWSAVQVRRLDRRFAQSINVKQPLPSSMESRLSCRLTSWRLRKLDEA